MDIGIIQNVDIDEQMRTAYLDYAMSVIVARALPDARDGLKPVHRRILYAMHDMGMRSTASFKKSARIVGEVLGKYHPHGDSAVYDAMARMAQDFSMRYMLVDGQGNFGSVDGDAPAAMRYTEARLAATAEEILADIDKNTVDFGDNFDGSLQEPLVMPGRLPNLLLNGSSGIAVGMATNIPPHNLRELAAAINYLIDNYDDLDNVSVDALLGLLPGPDFPTGGVIVGTEGILQAYSTGRGRIILRGLAEIEEMKNGRFAIIITEIPFQVNKSGLVERIAELVREGRIDAISDMRDESDRRGMRIVIELRRGAQPRQVLNQLYKYTPLQSTFGVHLLALLNGEPRVLTLKRALHIYIEHREEVITRRSQFELDKARQRAHILEGLLIALANLDEVIRTIRQSRDVEMAKEQLITRFKLSEAQAQAILDMQLRRLAALERQKIETEHQEVLERVAYLEDLLANPKKILEVVRADLNQIVEKFGDDRRTRIVAEAGLELKLEDLVQDESVLITLTHRGYIKRTNASVYRAQGRGGRGVSGQSVRDEDAVLMMIPARTLQSVLFFTNRGKVFTERVYRVPDAGRAERGTPLVNVLNMEGGEQVTAAVVVPDFERARFATMATRKGRVKRVPLSEFSNVRPSGMIAINLDKGDELGWVRLTGGSDEVILVTEGGRAVRFAEKQVRAMGRAAAGVNGINFREGDRLAGMEVVEPGGSLLVVTRNGYGKRTPLEDYPAKSRGTGGVVAVDQKNLPLIGKVAAVRVVQPSDDLSLISANGVLLRLKVKDIPTAGRGARGSRLIQLGKGDTMASLARIVQADIIKAVNEAVETNGSPDGNGAAAAS